MSKRSKKAASVTAEYSSSSEEDAAERDAEEMQYDRLAILDKPSKSQSLAKALLSLRRSPRHNVEIPVEKPSGQPKTLTKTVAKRKMQAAEEVEVSAKNEKFDVLATKEE